MRIYYTLYNKKLKEGIFRKYLKSLPVSFRNKIIKYKKWDDRYASLFGKLLLKRALDDLNLKDELENVQYTSYGRPYLLRDVDFNISHSSGCVVLVISEKVKVGIDVEKVTPIDIKAFANCFSRNEWSEINEGTDIYSKFYNYWTKKEAVTKADGRGLGIPLENLEVLKDHVYVNEMKWEIQLIELNEEYKAHVATAKKQLVKMIAVDFYSNAAIRR